MAVAVVSHYPDLNLATYDEVVASLELDANPPAGAILRALTQLLIEKGVITRGELMERIRALDNGAADRDDDASG